MACNHGCKKLVDIKDGTIAGGLTFVYVCLYCGAQIEDTIISGSSTTSTARQLGEGENDDGLSSNV